LALVTFGAGCDRSSSQSASAEAPAQTEQGALASSNESRSDDNRPPVIDDITFEPSKFVSCGETTRICVSASDPDGDAMVVDWTADPDLETGPEVVETTREGNQIEECITARPTPGTTSMFVRIVEATSETDPGTDSLEFPLHMSKDCR
jgi:hypothetical protein